MSDKAQFSNQALMALNRVPNLIRNWFVLILVSISIGLLCCALLIKLPRKIIGSMKLEVQNPPSTVFAQKSGRLILIDRQDSNIHKGDLIAYINPVGNLDDLLYVKKIIDTLQWEEIYPLESIINSNTGLRLGQMQQPFTAFVSSYQEVKYRNIDQSELRQIDLYTSNIRDLESKIDQLNRNLEVKQRQVQAASKNFEIDKKLHEQQAISSYEFNIRSSGYYNTLSDLEYLRTEIADSEVLISEMKSKMEDLRRTYDKETFSYQSDLINKLNNLRSAFDEWEQQHLIHASTTGNLTLKPIVTSNKLVEPNEVIGFISSKEESGIQINVSLPPQGIGEIQPGQQVNIKLDAYPFEKFGVIRGQILSVSPIQVDNEYWVLVDIPKKQNSLHLYDGMSGIAEIIIDHTTAFERLTYFLRKLNN